ncbi:MAG: hypothetical protein WCH84_11705, partial [Verrucomicrobiota bacterium]
MRMIPAKWLAVGLLAIMIGLMVGASLQDSATVDETGHLALGYINWNGARTRLGAEMHPPLASLVVSFPLLFMNVKLSDTAQAMVQGELGYPWTPSWQGTLRPIQGLLVPGCRGQYVRIPPLGDTLIQWQSPTTYPVDNWYYRAMPEGQMFGKVVVYGGANNGDAMLLLGRLAQILLSALTGVVIFFWARRVAVQENAAVLALALWVFNPIALAYGHVVNTDIGATLGITL